MTHVDTIELSILAMYRLSMDTNMINIFKKRSVWSQSDWSPATHNVWTVKSF